VYIHVCSKQLRTSDMSRYVVLQNNDDGGDDADDNDYPQQHVSDVWGVMIA
jgi:hypothetical protein